MLRGINKQLSSMDTGSMIEMSRMQLKTFSYMLTKSIKGGDFSIQVMPIKVYKSAL